MLTPVVEKNPNALFSAPSHAQNCSPLLSVDFCERRALLMGTFKTAHRSKENNVGGTIIVFAKNNQRILCVETNMNGN